MSNLFRDAYCNGKAIKTAFYRVNERAELNLRLSRFDTGTVKYWWEAGFVQPRGYGTSVFTAVQRTSKQHSVQHDFVEPSTSTLAKILPASEIATAAACRCDTPELDAPASMVTWLVEKRDKTCYVDE